MLALRTNMKSKFWRKWSLPGENIKCEAVTECVSSFLGYTFLFSTPVHNINILSRERDFVSHNCTKISDFLLPNGQALNYSDFIAKDIHVLNSINNLNFIVYVRLSLRSGTTVYKRNQSVLYRTNVFRFLN